MKDTERDNERHRDRVKEKERVSEREIDTRSNLLCFEHQDN